MQFTVYGYNQIKLVELGLDTTDIVLLRYVEKFINSGNMVEKNFKGEIYYWLNYKNIVEDLPILNLKKDAIYRRLRYMTSLNLLNHITVKDKGIYSYYKLGTEYKNLVSKAAAKRGKNLRIFYEDLSEDSVEKTAVPKDGNPYPSGSVSTAPKILHTEQKTPLLEYPFTKDLKNIKKDIQIAAVEYLNSKCGTSYKASSKKIQRLIKKRESEGFTLKDFYKVIDNKSKQWLDTDMEQYLRPETLFGTKFESYLNENSRRENKNAAYKESSGEIRKYEVGFSI